MFKRLIFMMPISFALLAFVLCIQIASHASANSKDTECYGCDEYLAWLKTDRVKCTEITDRFCEVLWNPKNSGVITIEEHQLWPGGRKEKALLERERQYFLAMIHAVKRLPKGGDLATALRKPVNELEDHLRSEAPAVDWYYGLERIEECIKVAIGEVARARTWKKFPALKAKAPRDRTSSEKKAIEVVEMQVNDELMKFSYEEGPFWKKALSSFDSAKKYILSAIEKASWPEDQKKWARDRIRSTELSLPYRDPSILGASASCSSTERN